MCGPPLKDSDFNVSKQVRLRKRVGMEFRADLFNLFNHPNLNVPVNTAAVGTSGGNGDQIFLGRDASGNAIPATHLPDRDNVAADSVWAQNDILSSASA